MTNGLRQRLGRRTIPSSSRASWYMTRTTACAGRLRSKTSGLSQRTATVLATRRCLNVSSCENRPANCNRNERNSLSSMATIVPRCITQTGADIHPQPSPSTHSVSDDTASIHLFLPESTPSPVENVRSALPASLPTKVLSGLVRARSINERAKKTDLLTKGDDNRLCDAIIENKHVRFIGDGAGHDLLRTSARAQLSPSRRDIGDQQDIGRSSDKSKTALTKLSPSPAQGMVVYLACGKPLWKPGRE